MKNIILWGIFWTIFTISVAVETSSPYGFIFTSGNNLVTGRNNELHFRRIGNSDSGNLRVQVFYEEEFHSASKSVAADQNFEIPKDKPDIVLQLPVKKVDEKYSYATLEIKGTFGSYTISGNHEVRLVTRPSSIFIIQTDKPLYQPGQTVKFRLLRVDKDFKPFQDYTKADVYVQDAKGSRLFQFNDIDVSQGIVQYKFPLSDEPVKGKWTITASTKDATTTADFEVKDYVLPKFDVKIIPPPYVLANSESFPIKICSKYTYGKPVALSLQLNVSLENYDYSLIDKLRTLQTSVQINGCFEYIVNVSLIEPGTVYTNSRIKVVANVGEVGTGVNKVITQYIDRVTSPLKLTFSPEQRWNYKPGLPFNGKLQVSNPDDTPAVGEPVEICAFMYKTTNITEMSAALSPLYQKNCRNYTSDDNGSIKYIIVAKTVDIIQISITATSFKHIEVNPGPQRPTRTLALVRPSAQIIITPFYSPSGSFVQLQPVPRVPCGIRKTFKILFTAKTNEDFQFYYQVTRHNDLIVTGTVKKYFSAQDDVSNVYENDANQIDTNIIQTDPTNRNLPLIGYVEIDIDVDTKLSQEFYLLVYYIRNDKETVADSQKIYVEECFQNKVDFAFGDKAKQPGLPTKVQITASPNSLCGIKTIDKSITLLDSSDQLNKDNVFWGLKHMDALNYDSSTDPCSSRNFHPGNVHPFYGGIREPDYISPILPRPFSPIRYPPIRYPQTITYSSSYKDALTSFETSGLLVISDLILITRPCVKEIHYMPDYWLGPPIIAGLRGGGGIRPSAINLETANGFIPQPAPIVSPEPSKSISSTTSVKEVRDYFPETWLFELEMTGPDGTFVENKQLPDTVTEWIGNAVCINSKDGLGISNTASITALQSFFIDYTLPVSVIRGEEFVVVVSIFSYADSDFPITVTVTNSDGFQVISESIDGDYCMEPDRSLNLNITLKATEVGKVNITVVAETSDSENVCDSYYDPRIYARDSITKPIEVEPEGFPVEKVINALFCPSDNQDAYENTITLSVPKNVIPDSSRAYMDFTGNVMGQAIKNIDSLVTLPTGCGEQNMVKFTPNKIALDYLKSINMLTDDIKSRAVSNLNTGYQRELNYRHRDGSFSAFGESDKEGSTFLTAFVLRSFYEAKEYIYVDDGVIDAMKNWIVARQNADGCFQNVGRILDIGLEGGLDKDKSSGSITAYVLASLLKSNFKIETIKEKAFSCLVNNPPLNPYSQLLYAYAEALAGRNSIARKYIAEARQKITETEGMESFIIVQGTEAINIEAVAYAMLSTLAVGEDASKVLPYVRYLTNHLNPYGGFHSTQDTCVGLAALAEFAKPVFKNSLNLEIITTGGLQKIVHITDANKLLVQRFKIADVPSKVTIEAHGTGCGLIQSSIRYNTKTPPEKKKFAIEVTGECSFSDCKHATLNVLVSYLPPGEKSGMSIVEIKLISGFVADRASLDKLKSDEKNNILRIDVQNNMVIFYFTEFSNTVSGFSFQVEQEVYVINAKPGTAKAYDYYANENSASTSYTIKGFNSEINYEY